MKIIIEDECFSYQVDWSKDPQLEEGDIVPVDDVMIAFCHLLENLYSDAKIAEGLTEALDARR